MRGGNFAIFYMDIDRLQLDRRRHEHSEAPGMLLYLERDECIVGGG